MKYGVGSIVAALLVGGCVINVNTDKGFASGETGDTTPTVTTTETGTPIDTGATGDTGDSGLDDPDADGDTYPLSVDCNDNDDTIHPDADEACDGIDNNCDTYVDDTFAATIDTTSYATLDEALLAVVDGTRIDVCPGDHTITSVGWTGGELRLRGVAGSEFTTLHEAVGATLFSVGEDSILGLRGLTLTGANPGTSRALRVEDNGTLELTESVVQGSAGGGLELLNTSAAVVLVTDSTLANNGVASDPYTYAPVSPAQGGAILAVGAFDLTLTNSTIDQNTAEDGGGIHATTYFGTGAITLDGTTISANLAEGSGGGLRVANVSVTGANGAALSGNEAVEGGGAVLVKSPISGVLVTQNTALETGGGLSTVYDSLFALAPMDNALVGVVIDSNTADLGGGIAAGEDLDLDGTSAVTLNSAATDGGAVWIPADNVTVTSAGADFGSAASGNDNVPNDVSANATAFNYDGAATFTCVGTTGC